jgi:GH15 family glucan-1,4-alpha-glucosidase
MAPPARIEEYAMIGDLHTAGLVRFDGSLDWLCVPRFDSAACFAALLGEPGNGRWRLAPAMPPTAVRRCYRDGTLILETEYEIGAGAVRVIDWMPPRGPLDHCPQVIRVAEGLRGRVDMRMELVIRFDYGSIVPWVRRVGPGRDRLAVGGPDAILFSPGVDIHGENRRHVAEFALAAGDRTSFTLTWHRAHDRLPGVVDVERSLSETEAWWRDWADRCSYDGPYREPVLRSLITLKALTYEPTGGIIAAPTSSLPEWIGGTRNWDYRYCWLRDATLTLDALMLAGYRSEAQAWRDWLLRAVAGDPGRLQIMYGPAGERRLPEFEVRWLSGFAGSRPVRVGNGAADQFQLDVYGEVADALHKARQYGIGSEQAAWNLERALLREVAERWSEPDEGIWEVRGGRRHFTHSKVMAWVAVDRGIKAIEQFGLVAPCDELARWRAVRREIHQRVLDEGYDRERNAFTQSLGSKELDASLLLIPLVGFLPPTDERVLNTLAAIERELVTDGLVMRYSHGGAQRAVDGLPPGEGAFLACSFWLADNLLLVGRADDSRRLFERLLSLRNDVGLLAEEYDPAARAMLGNFPQAFSHLGLIGTALRLSKHGTEADGHSTSTQQVQ